MNLLEKIEYFFQKMRYDFKMLRKSNSRGFIGLLALILSVAILGWLWWKQAPGSWGKGSPSQMQIDIGAVQRAKQLQNVTDAHNAQIEAAIEGK